MPILKYSYSPDAYLDSHTMKMTYYFRPYVPILLGSGHRLSKISVNCLLDSGADRILFPSDWGASLGINSPASSLSHPSN